MRHCVSAVILASVPSIALAAPVTYNGSQSTIQYNPTYVNGGLNWTGTQFINGTKVIYDSATDSYTVRDTGSTTKTSTFTGGTAGADYTAYTKTSGGVTETLKVLNKSNTLLATPLTYVTFAKWSRDNQPGWYSRNDTYVVFGTLTPRAAMPHTGGASYATTSLGTWVDKNGVYDVTGNGTIAVDFGSGALTYDSTLSGARQGGGAGIAFGTLSGTGSIANGGPAFKGTGAINANGYGMNIWGNFYGTGADAASEVGGNFSLRGDAAHRGSGTGAFAGN